jgi:hypothetical protein
LSGTVPEIPELRFDIGRAQMRGIRIAAGKVETLAILNDTKTAGAIWGALPIEARASTWGDEIYFEIPVSLDEDHPEAIVQMGDLGYWPPGRAFCIFFGPTPASIGLEIRPASPVNVFGKLEGDATILKSVRSGATVWISKST